MNMHVKPLKPLLCNEGKFFLFKHPEEIPISGTKGLLHYGSFPKESYVQVQAGVDIQENQHLSSS